MWPQDAVHKHGCGEHLLWYHLEIHFDLGMVPRSENLTVGKKSLAVSADSNQSPFCVNGPPSLATEHFSVAPNSEQQKRLPASIKRKSRRILQGMFMAFRIWLKAKDSLVCEAILCPLKHMPREKTQAHTTYSRVMKICQWTEKTLPLFSRDRQLGSRSLARHREEQHRAALHDRMYPPLSDGSCHGENGRLCWTAREAGQGSWRVDILDDHPTGTRRIMVVSIFL